MVFHIWKTETGHLAKSFLSRHLKAAVCGETSAQMCNLKSEVTATIYIPLIHVQNATLFTAKAAANRSGWKHLVTLVVHTEDLWRRKKGWIYTLQFIQNLRVTFFQDWTSFCCITSGNGEKLLCLKAISPCIGWSYVFNGKEDISAKPKDHKYSSPSSHLTTSPNIFVNMSKSR